MAAHRRDERAAGEKSADKLVQYYLAERGRLSDGALALLAARGALLGHARWHQHPSYARWHDQAMTKVVLAAMPDELAALRRRATDSLALDQEGRACAADEPAVLIVRPPQPRPVVAPLLNHLRLAPKARGETPEPAARPALVLVAAGDLGMHGGKLAAQCAHAVLLAQRAYSRRAAWAEWIAADRPLALRRAESALLSALAERYPAGAVHDAGHTQVAAGTLTVIAVPPGTADADRVLADLPRW